MSKIVDKGNATTIGRAGRDGAIEGEGDASDSFNSACNRNAKASATTTTMKRFLLRRMCTYHRLPIDEHVFVDRC
jgi:hypothetical protein